MKDYKDIKICVYAITASEPTEFIDRWLKSMNGADYICVLVTKGNDPNFDYFNSKKKDYPQLILDQKTIAPWRFDVARNESMKLIPEDSDVIVCVDIDEVLIEDFWDDLRKVVAEHPNFDRIFYRYAWSHDSNGNAKWVFWYDKITQPKGWKWEFPVHESLQLDSNYHYSGLYYMDRSKVYLHHFPDKTKSRGSYLGLLKMRAEEHQDDLYGLFYLAREYSFKTDYKNALTTAYDLYLRITDKPERDDMMMMPALLNMLGDYSRKVSLADDAEYWYRKAIKTDPAYRDSYMKLAQHLAYQPKPSQVYEVLEEMDKNSVYKEDWRLTTYYWRDWKKYQIIADAKCWEGKYTEALVTMDKALADIKTEDDKMDAINEGLFGDYAFIKKKLEKPINILKVGGKHS